MISRSNHPAGGLAFYGDTAVGCESGSALAFYGAKVLAFGRTNTRAFFAAQDRACTLQVEADAAYGIKQVLQAISEAVSLDLLRCIKRGDHEAGIALLKIIQDDMAEFCKTYADEANEADEEAAERRSICGRAL